jgi:hypothetical protein
MPALLDNSKQARLRALQRQIKILEKRIAQLSQISFRYSIARLVFFIIGLFSSIAIHNFFSEWLGWLLAFALALAFGYLVYRHRRFEISLERHKLWHEIKSNHIARIELNWAKLSPKLSVAAEPAHPFELDLDLTGSRSLHTLLDTAISRKGSERLRHWLLNTKPNPEISLQRQALVRELAPLVLYRDKLTLTAMQASQNSRAHWESETLIAWLEKSKLPKIVFPILVLLSLLAGVNILLFTLHQVGLLPNVWLYSFVLYGILYFSQRNQINPLFQEALALENVLDKFKSVIEYIETQTPRDKPYLATLCAPILDASHKPSAQIKEIARIAQASQLQRNPFLWPVVNALLPWDLYFVYRLHRSRTQIARLLPRWLDIWFELEALLSLANFAYLNPEYAFPKIVSEGLSDRKQATLLYGEALGHPLIEAQKKICNDFELDKRGDIVIVTGSNMSGKSTFLRTLGINLCLAQAGGPVNARSFAFAPMRLFACIKVSDSLADGISYFYAEVRRLKALLLELEKPDSFPLFFLIDEIFKGTNNRERLLGSSAYIRALTAQNGLGLVATHDLELIKLADEIASIKNYHFREEVFNGKMTFDYTLHSGPCPTTNALKIMKLEGLPI